MANKAARALERLAYAVQDGALKLALPLIDSRVPRSGYRVLADLAYGPAARQKLDLYVPDGLTAPAPVLLFFYGGSWQSGSKAIYRAFGQAFASEGIVTAVADYRLYPEVRYPAFVEDGALALRFLRRQAGAQGGDPDRLFVSGHSAGAYIATMLAVNADYLKAVDLSPAAIRGVIGLAGPYDFLPLYDPALIDIFGGARVMATQPIKHVAPGAPPMLLAHGTGDTTVGAGNSRRFARRLAAADNAVELIEYRGIGHLGIILSLARDLRRRTTLHADMLRFIAAL
ncbi:MAG: alpha/beta hydrolase [Rhizomicrobium sp.]